MGKNLDLIDMLGLSAAIKCPHCGAEIKSDYDDHDVQCSTEYDKGHWKIHRSCGECNKDFTHEFQLRFDVVKS